MTYRTHYRAGAAEMIIESELLRIDGDKFRIETIDFTIEDFLIIKPSVAGMSDGNKITESAMANLKKVKISDKSFYSVESALKVYIVLNDILILDILIMENGKLGVIDFGCVKKLDDNFISNIMCIYNDNYDNNMSRLKEIYGSIGIFYKKNTGNGKFKKFITNWIEWITRPRRKEYFDFSKETEYFNEGLKYVREFYSYINYFDGSFTYFGRTEYGLFRLLQAIGARVKMQFK